MGYWVGDLNGSTAVLREYKIAAADADEGEVTMRQPTAATQGEAITATTTAALNALGCADADATYTATQAADMVEGIVRVISNPFAVWRFVISGGATEDTAWAAGSTILTNDTAETAGTTIADADIPNVDTAGGIVKGRTGANAGHSRYITAHTDATSIVVTVPFPNDIAAGDTFIQVPYSAVAIAMQGTTNVTQADGSIVPGTGIPVCVHKLVIDEENDRGWLDVTFRTHYYNSLA